MELNQPGNWELYYEDETKKIWHSLSKNFGSVGWIDFDLSLNKYACPVYEYWDEENGFQYVEYKYIDYSKPWRKTDPRTFSVSSYGDRMPMSIEDELVQNLTFISRPDYIGLSAFSGDKTSYRNTDLYLRCDEGNPADCFQIIKLSDNSRVAPFQSVGHTEITLDNLNICNCGQWGVGHLDHSTIQNCIFGWVGNQVTEMNSWNDDDPYAVNMGYIGDAVYSCGDGVSVVNNYFHHICCCAVGIENMTGDHDPTVISSNVMCYMGVGYVWANDARWSQESLHVTVCDNYLAYAGEVNGIFRWNDFDGLLLRAVDDTTPWTWIQGTAAIAAGHKILNNTIIGGYDSSFSTTVAGMLSYDIFSQNTFVGKPEDHLLMLTDCRLVVDYGQVCE